MDIHVVLVSVVYCMLHSKLDAAIMDICFMFV